MDVVEKIRRDSFISFSTSDKIMLLKNGTLSSNADIEKIIISDKSERELYWEKFKDLLNQHNTVPD